MKILFIDRKKIQPYKNILNEEKSKHIAEVINVINSEKHIHPVVIDIEGCIITGFYMYQAFKRIQIDMIPVCIGYFLNEDQITTFRLADKNSKSYFTDAQIFDMVCDEYRSPAGSCSIGIKELEFLRKVIHAQDYKNKHR